MFVALFMLFSLSPVNVRAASNVLLFGITMTSAVENPAINDIVTVNIIVCENPGFGFLQFNLTSSVLAPVMDNGDIVAALGPNFSHLSSTSDVTSPGTPFFVSVPGITNNTGVLVTIDFRVTGAISPGANPADLVTMNIVALFGAPAVTLIPEFWCDYSDCNYCDNVDCEHCEDSGDCCDYCNPCECPECEHCEDEGCEECFVPCDTDCEQGCQGFGNCDEPCVCECPDCTYCDDEGCEECFVECDTDCTEGCQGFGNCGEPCVCVCEENGGGNGNGGGTLPPPPPPGNGGTPPPPPGPGSPLPPPGTHLIPWQPGAGQQAQQAYEDVEGVLLLAYDDDAEPLLGMPTPPERRRRVIRFEMNNLVYTIDAVPHTNDVAPFIDPAYDRTMIPLRAVSEALGAEVEWIGATRTVLIFIHDEIDTLLVDVSIPGGMGVPVIISDRVLVPLRFVAERLGAEVRWDGANRAAYVYMFE